jgi:GT2 family glycosyltransferase
MTAPLDHPLIAARSPGLDPSAVTIAVVLPTYRRPAHLARTMQSVFGPGTPPGVALVVVENDVAGGEGIAMAAKVFAEGTAAGVGIVEPRQGNCNAYNAGFAAALAHFPNLSHVAIIDDDEIASAGWIAALLAAARRYGADIVGGPQVPIFEDKAAARRFANHPIFRPAHAKSGDAGLITSTGNCLMRIEVLRAMIPDFLDARFNFIGGGDTDFFTRCRARGFTFAWAADAAVWETVPPRRTERSWITARSVRNGLISALIQRKYNPGLAGRLKVIAKSLALLCASPIRLLPLWRETGSLYAGTYHMMVAAGRILAEFGYSIEQYRTPEKN